MASTEEMGGRLMAGISTLRGARRRSRSRRVAPGTGRSTSTSTPPTLCGPPRYAECPPGTRTGVRIQRFAVDIIGMLRPSRCGREGTRSAGAGHERLEQLGARALSDAELLAVLLGPTAGANNVRDAAKRLLDEKPLPQIAWASTDDLRQETGIGPARAAALVAAFELGRRGAWSPPKRGERLQDPARVYELLRDVAHAEREQFHVVLLDVRCRLIKTAKISEGSLTQCPVAPRDVLREALRVGAHGVIFVHNHPSGYPTRRRKTMTSRSVSGRRPSWSG